MDDRLDRHPLQCKACMQPVNHQVKILASPPASLKMLGSAGATSTCSGRKGTRLLCTWRPSRLFLVDEKCALQDSVGIISKVDCENFQQPFKRFPGSQRKQGAAVWQRKLTVLHKQVRDLEFTTKALPIVTETGGLTGRWRKDKGKSDSLEPACEMIKLPWIYRKALALLNNMVVEDSEETLTTTLKAGGIMDVVESYPYSGEVVKHRRRDKRKGHHLGKVKRTDTGASIEVTWENPYGGYATDSFILSENGSTLVQETDITLRDTGQRALYRIVYKRVH